MVDGHSPAGDYAFDKYNKVLRLLTLCLDAIKIWSAPLQHIEFCSALPVLLLFFCISVHYQVWLTS
jgi:hypothetical protein